MLMVLGLCFITDGENRIDIILTSNPGKWYCTTSLANLGYIVQAHSDCYVNFLLIEIIYILFYTSSKASWTKCTFIIWTVPSL